MKIIKLFASIFLVLSLTLPLSTCQGPVDEGSSSESKRIQRYVVSDITALSEWGWVIPFVLPLSLVLVMYRKPETIIKEIFFIISVCPALWVILGHSVTGKLTIGGYVALFLIFIFISTSVITMRKLNKIVEKEKM